MIGLYLVTYWLYRYIPFDEEIADPRLLNLLQEHVEVSVQETDSIWHKKKSTKKEERNQ